MDRNRFYGLLSLFYLMGLAWIGYSFQNSQFSFETDFSPCIVKNVTGFACPSCGSTRALMKIFQGNFTEAFFWNPIGYLYLVLLLIFPFWLTFDLIFKKKSILQFYHGFNSFFRHKWVFIPAICLIVANWIWNICKDY
jgi:hypothetical protein